MKVKTSVPPRNGGGWTVLLECGHTVYDVKSKKRPKNVNCDICQHPKRPD